MSTAFPILVVEDDADIRLGLIEVLADEGYEILSAENGEEALQLLKKRLESDLPPPAAILTDAMMPIMGGWDLLHALRQTVNWGSIPVIILSAADTPHKYTVKPDAFLKKPFSIPKLIELLKSKL